MPFTRVAIALAGRLRVLRTITLPFLRPALIASGLVAFLVASVSRTLSIMPFVPNHILFMLLVNLTLLLAILQQAKSDVAPDLLP